MHTHIYILYTCSITLRHIHILTYVGYTNILQPTNMKLNLEGNRQTVRLLEMCCTAYCSSIDSRLWTADTLESSTWKKKAPWSILGMYSHVLFHACIMSTNHQSILVAITRTMHTLTQAQAQHTMYVHIHNYAQVAYMSTRQYMYIYIVTIRNAHVT